jgi:hypothetical protein
MRQTFTGKAVSPVRVALIDLGVALMALVALALGGVLRCQVDGATRVYQEPNAAFRIAYPRSWLSAASSPDTLLAVEEPRTRSTFKTTLTVERRDLDTAAPPSPQDLVDRRIAQRGTLTAHRLLASDAATVGGAPASRIDYAYVAQPIDLPGGFALPVVVRAREYLIALPDRAYVVSLAAPEQEYVGALERFEQAIKQVRV